MLTARLVVLAAWSIGMIAVAPQATGQDAEMLKRANAATALVVSDTRNQLGAAFCAHDRGLFVTTTGVAESADEIYLVLESGRDEERKVRAEILRRDAETGLVLLTTDRRSTSLELGDEAVFDPATPVALLGFTISRFGVVTDQYPAVDVKNCRVDSMHKVQGTITDIRLDVALNPGKSGGPLIDSGGKVIGIIRSSGSQAAVTSAVPISALKSLLERPNLTFSPPELTLSRIHDPTRFTARMTCSFCPAAPRLELRLKANDDPERRFPIPRSYRDQYSVDVSPVGSLIGVLIEAGDGSIIGQVVDQKFKIGDREASLRQTRTLDFTGTTYSSIGQTMRRGEIKGLESVLVQLGNAEVIADLSKATDIRLSPKRARTDIFSLSYAIVALVGDREVARLSGPLEIEGLHPVEDDADVIDYRLPAPIYDLAVGGSGRWLVLHLKEMRKLAIYDVVAAKVVHELPLAEEHVMFAASRSKLLVVSPDAGVIQRWDLKTFKHEDTAPLPIDGPVGAVAMGSGSHGPLLVSWCQLGARPTPRWSLLDIERLSASDLSVQLASLNYPQFASALASTDGTVFLNLLTSYPGGDAWRGLALEDTPTIIQGPGKWPAFPGPNGRHIFTARGIVATDGKLVEKTPEASLFLPAMHGDHYLAVTYTAAATPGRASTAEVKAYVVGDDRPIAQVPSIDFRELSRAERLRLTLAKRILFIPQAKQIITIPTGDDRLVLHHFDTDKALADRD